MKVFWDKHSNSSTPHTFNAQSKDADWTGTSLFLQLLLKLVFLKKVFHLEISEIILCLKKSIKCLLEVGFFHSSLKVKKNISVSMANFKRFNWYSYLFSLSSRHYWIQPKSLCPTKPELSSATWHDYVWFKFWRAHLEIHFLLFTAFIVPHLFYFSTLLTPQLL